MARRGGRVNWSNAGCYEPVNECLPYDVGGVSVIQDRVSEPIREVINLNPCPNHKILDVVDINSEAYVSNCNVTICDNYVMIDGFIKKNIIYSFIEDFPGNNSELRPCTFNSYNCAVLDTELGNLIAWYPFSIKVKVCDANILVDCKLRCISIKECLQSDRFIYEECPILTLPGIFLGTKIFPIIAIVANDIVTVDLVCTKS
ncbi:MAG TPA: hypothetical protein DEP72_05650 [Clostridiales bacterium]|nr:MAG: hypothetical protein A2Y18_02740 [Clostridiales bacterium GWD2_32_19]HCC07627.1 hypothetical protein [Clostridiales bacterium]